MTNAGHRHGLGHGLARRDGAGHSHRGLRFALGMAGCLAIWLASATGADAAGFYRDSPVMAEKAHAGEIPPVARRLPSNPLLVQVEERLGDYGGTWDMAMLGAQDGLLIYRTLGYEPLMRWDSGWLRVIPNVAQSFQANVDGTEFLFRLRPGMRWSDGQPFTAEDIRFWFEAVISEPDLSAETQRWRQTGNTPDRVVVVDPHTVRFVFRSPNSQFLASLASGKGERGPTDFPRHALMRYHKRYNPQGIDAEVKAAGVRDWVELFVLKSQIHRGRSTPSVLLRRKVDGDPLPTTKATPVPTLEPWVIDRIEAGEPPLLVAERNPYYWKVDPAGNQLPYIDRLSFALVRSPEEMLRLATEGRIGMQARHFAGMMRRDQGVAAALRIRGYHTVSLLNAETNTLPFVLNQTHPDPVKRALYQQRDFRIALSRAIDRQAVIDRALNGMGEPYQVAPRPESRFYRTDLAFQHIAYDLTQAETLLDSLGVTARNPQGYRLMADGRPLSITVLVRRELRQQVRALQVIREQWRDLGVDLEIREVERAEMTEAMDNNAFDAAIGNTDGGIDAMMEAWAYMPLTADSAFAPAWVRWLHNPADPDGMEPPPAVQQQFTLYERIRRTVEPAEQDRLMQEILSITAREFFVFGVSLPPNGQGLLRDDFRNVPAIMFEAWQWPTPAPTNPAQYFIIQR